MTIEKLGVDFTMKNARMKVKDNVNLANVLGKKIIYKIYKKKKCLIN